MTENEFKHVSKDAEAAYLAQKSKYSLCSEEPLAMVLIAVALFQGLKLIACAIVHAAHIKKS